MSTICNQVAFGTKSCEWGIMLTLTPLGHNVIMCRNQFFSGILAVHSNLGEHYMRRRIYPSLVEGFLVRISSSLRKYGISWKAFSKLFLKSSFVLILNRPWRLCFHMSARLSNVPPLQKCNNLWISCEYKLWFWSEQHISLQPRSSLLSSRTQIWRSWTCIFMVCSIVFNIFHFWHRTTWCYFYWVHTP
jgi:hypothetical protein